MTAQNGQDHPAITFSTAYDGLLPVGAPVPYPVHPSMIKFLKSYSDIKEPQCFQL